MLNGLLFRLIDNLTALNDDDVFERSSDEIHPFELELEKEIKYS